MYNRELGLVPHGICAICKKEVSLSSKSGMAGLGSFLLFKDSPSRPAQWVHATCAKRAIETWILKKESKET